ncbi:hypothetical protein [Roseovarius mucosus]|uniref:hypothetical protein n=1 Tax=Roseovarius mucosus TaxID=215743 RepID=UPI0009D9E0E1
MVNIGIGSSKLGPAIATLSLAPYHDGPRCHFVANIDSVDVPQALVPHGQRPVNSGERQHARNHIKPTPRCWRTAYENAAP